MSLHAKTLLNLLVGAVAGLLAWLLTDATGWYEHTLRPLTSVGPGVPGYGSYLFYGALFGGLLGLLLGIVDGLSLDSLRQMITALNLGALVGFLGGGLGLAMGQRVYGAFGGSDSPNQSAGQFLLTLIARALGWGIIGAITGAAQGVARRSTLIARQGAFGGLFGGLLGGTTFQIASILLGSDVPARLVALMATGALTGFFVGLVQDLFKQAWVRVLVGRNEGKEYLIAKPIMVIGRSELADIGLFGDPSIAPRHAVIESLPGQNRHRLRHVAGGQGAHAYPPTVVNGRPVTAEQWLTDGDTIQIGGRTLQFEEKATRGAAPRPAPTAAPSVGDTTVMTGAAVAAPSYTPRPNLTTSPDVVDQMGTAPPEAPPAALSPVLSQFSASVSEREGPLVTQSSRAVGARLTAISGPYAGQSFPLNHQLVTIGRAKERDIALSADNSVSRAHASVSYESGRHLVEDDGSSNGTLVNHQRLSAPRPLRPGDIIQIGETSLRYE